MAPSAPTPSSERALTHESDFPERRQEAAAESRRLLGTGLLTRNAAVNLLGQAAPLVVAVAAIPLLIPRIGTERFGLLVIAWIVLGYFSLFDMGLGRSLTQLVGDRLGRGRREEIPSLVRTGLFLLGAVGVAGGALLLLVAPLLAREVLNLPPELVGETLAALRLLAVAVPFVVVTAGLRGLLEAVQRFGWVNAIRVPQGVLTYLGPLAVLPLSRELPALVGALIVVRIGSWAAHAVLVARAFPRAERTGDAGSTPARRPDGVWSRDTRALLGLGGWITVSNVVGPLMVYVDRFLIGAVLTAAAVAYYATPFEVVSRLWIVPGAVVAVFFPAFATSFRADPGRAASLFRDSLRLVLLCIFPLAFVFMAFAPEGLTLWVGEEFARPGAPVARWLVAGMLVNAVAQVPFAFLQGVGRPDVTAKLHLAEAPFYFVLLWVLVARYGITGAAVAWTIRVTVDAALLSWLSAKVLPETRAGSVEAWKWTAAGLAVLGAAVMPFPGPAARAGVLAGLAALAGWGAWRGLVPVGIKRRLARGVRGA